MAKTIEFKVNSPKPFCNYLKKFSSIDSTVLFEVDLKNKGFIAKSPNEERSIVKYGNISFEDAGFKTTSKSDIRIKVGIYNISRLIKIMEQFGSELTFTIKYDDIITKDKSKDYAATSLLLCNDEIKFSIECTSLNIFKYISDDLYNNVIRKVDEVITFDFTKETIERISALCELDKDFKLLEFNNKNGKLYAKGKSFEFLIVPTINYEIKIPIYKDQFNKIDVEKYRVHIAEDRMLFSSLDTNTEVIVSKVEVDDNYEEISNDL